jgi:23S rRNA pseudouridine1911/1915/1917 synthase
LFGNIGPSYRLCPAAIPSSHMKSPLSRTVTAHEADAGERIDRLLSRRFDDVSRARIQRLILSGSVQVDGRTIVEPSFRVKPATEIRIVLPEPTDPSPRPEAIRLDVIYEDSHLIVIDKPAGLVVHPAPGHRTGTLVNALIAHCGASLSGIGGVRRPGIVHRLDKDTSGLLVVAKTDEAHKGLSERFAAHGEDGGLERVYQAVIWGKPPRREGVISAPLGRSSANRQKMTVRASGRRAITHYRVVKTFDLPGKPTVIECRLETGRTHQIRVHLTHLGHPLLGDQLYGKGFLSSARRLPAGPKAALDNLGRQALHAGHLAFAHPITGQFLTFDSPPPPDLKAVLDSLSAAEP